MIKRILKLARGNQRLVIFDSETERAFVVLPLGVYERMRHEAGHEFDDDELDDFDEDWTPPALDELELNDIWTAPLGEASAEAPWEEKDLTEDNLIDSIEHDIAAWKAAQEEAPEEEATDVAAILDELTLTPVPGAEGQATPPASGEEEKFYIEPVG